MGSGAVLPKPRKGKNISYNSRRRKQTLHIKKITQPAKYYFTCISKSWASGKSILKGHKGNSLFIQFSITILMVVILCYIKSENFRLLAVNYLICMIKAKADQTYSSHILGPLMKICTLQHFQRSVTNQFLFSLNSSMQIWFDIHNSVSSMYWKRS